MPTLEILHTRTFDAEMSRLRCECFPGQYPTGDAKDEFDDRSVHVVTCVDGQLAGYGRLTPGPNSWFEFRSRGKAVIPTGANVVDFGRVVVAPPHRGHDHFELVLVEGLLWAADNAFAWVVGSFRPSRGFRGFIHDLGFADSGPVVEFRIGEHLFEPNQCVAVRTAESRARWAGRKADVLDRLREKGYDILDRGCDPSPLPGTPAEQK